MDMMSENPDYPEMNQIFGAYLNEDCSYWGNTIAEIVNAYKRDASGEDIRKAISEIERFTKENEGDLDSAFEEAYGSRFGPELWGYTTISFLEELKRILQG
ncbi:contact-dependent growth inhibition system immunity protein [Trinickia mobilis]|uniref:contact-dependent growth inhibition system immunity protein n=1 Tax=Trinickia mobilis TaxID=2816356 RepID=UPI002867E78C|nr:contact-dependent growth inhibition system immunity protein [Trinickia mobilis]